MVRLSKYAKRTSRRRLSSFYHIARLVTHLRDHTVKLAADVTGDIPRYFPRCYLNVSRLSAQDNLSTLNLARFVLGLSTTVMGECGRKPPITSTNKEQDQRKSSTLQSESLCFLSNRFIHQAVPNSLAVSDPLLFSMLGHRICRLDDPKQGI